MAAYNVWRGTGNLPPVLREGVHATKAFRFSSPSGRIYFPLRGPRHSIYSTLRSTTLRKIECASRFGHNVPRAVAARATGPLLSSQAGVKGSTSTYGTSQQTFTVKTGTSTLCHAQGKLVASCHTMGLSGLAPSTGHALQPMATFLVRTSSR